MTNRPHPWSFPRSIRPQAFGPRSSKLAALRLREALVEVRAVARVDPGLGADGAVRLLERIAPAFEGIDTSSGSLGTAANQAVRELIELVRAAEVEPTLRQGWVRRLRAAVQADGMGWLWQVDEHLPGIAGKTTTVTPAPIPPEPSVSKTFLDYVEPMLANLVDKPDEQKDYLATCQMVWNAVVLANCDRVEWLAALEDIDQPYRAAVEKLIDRKHAQFADHLWLVWDYELLHRDGEPRLRVEATDLSAIDPSWRPGD